MRRHVSDSPIEACGLLAGKDQHALSVIPISNMLDSPIRFRMDALEQLRAFEQMERDGLDLVAIYHSHPAGPIEPSPTDVAEAAYPVINIIWAPAIGEWQARGFWIENGQAVEVALSIDPV